MPTDPSVLYGAELVTVPYVSVPEFKVEPTFLQLDNLVSGSVSASANDAELNNKLIQASQWASDTANMPLHGHYVSEPKNLYVTKDGTLSWHPSHNPVQLITALSWAVVLGAPSTFTAITDLTGQWITGQAQVEVPFAPMSSGWNAIQLGPPASSRIRTIWQYLAGFANTTLASVANINDTTITVVDPTGFIGGTTGLFPGTRFRIWTPGAEEACTVASTYVVGSPTVPLVSALSKAHAVGDNASALPSTLKLAVTNYACALLSHPDTAAEDQFPDSRSQLTTRADDARKAGTGLVAEAYRLLRSYMRVR